MSGSSQLPLDAVRPRLCHLVQQPGFQGYGFNLHVEKAKAGHFVGDIDEGSPADGAGLRKGDKLIEVNGINIGQENHKQVVSRIKSATGETKLLVADKECLEYYEDKEISIRSDMGDVIEYCSNVNDPPSTPPPPPLTPPPQHDEKVELEEQKENMAPPSPSIGNNKIDAEELVGPEVRMCHMCKWKDFEGYGFNLHAEKGSSAHLVGLVDPGSPAELAALRPRDRIVEVNGRNVILASHKDVVTLIREVPNETRLLVADSETYAFYDSKNITISEQLPGVRFTRSPSVRPPPVVATEVTPTSLQAPAPPTSTSSSPRSQTSSSSHYTNGYHETQHNGSATGVDEASFEDNLKLSASEMKQKLSLRKKRDPKLDGVDMKKKHEIFQKM